MAEKDESKKGLHEFQNDKCLLLDCKTAWFSHYNLFKNVSGHRAILKALQKNSKPHSILKSEW